MPCYLQCDHNPRELVMTAKITDHKTNFLRYVSRFENNDCWDWTGARRARAGQPYDNLYGMYNMNGKMIGAHVASFILFKGPVPAGLDVAHKCHRKCCVNPDHLEAQTRSQNCKESYKDRSMNRAKGENNAASKLTAEQVKKLRRKYHEEKWGCVRLSREFGVSTTTVMNIINRKVWKDVE